LSDIYRAALEDGELIALREEQALLTATIIEVSKLIDMPDWDMFGDALTCMGQALQAHELDEAIDAFERLSEIFTKAKISFRSLREFRQLVEQKRKGSVTELARLEKLQQFLDVREVVAVQAAILDVLRRIVPQVLEETLQDHLERHLIHLAATRVRQEIGREFEIIGKEQSLDVDKSDSHGIMIEG